MNILSFEDYCVEEKKFCDQYNLYRSQTGEINRQEYFLAKRGELTLEKEEELERKREELTKEYKGYTSVFDADFACRITAENIDILLGTRATNSIFKSQLDLIGKEVKTFDECVKGVLQGIIYCMDDIYYEILTDNGVEYETAVSSLKLVNNE